MVGFCGIVGDFNHNLDSVTNSVVWSDREHDVRYSDNKFDFYISVHQSEEANTQPVTTDDGQQLSVWGDVLGFEGPEGYNSRNQEQTATAEYCLNLYKQHGLSFVDGLNSEFAGLVFDEPDDKLTLFTDRLSARPIFYTKSIDGAFLFSTHPKTILAHPEIEPSIDDELMIEFLTFERVFGTKTPFKEVTQLHPGSRLTYDIKNDSTSETIYWRPDYNPVDKSYDEFVEEFTDLYQQAVKERQQESVEEGVLISGGSDSRILLSLLGKDVTGYHMNENVNKEAEMAKRVCDVIGTEFRFLHRDINYQKKVLSKISGDQIYTSFFDQAHAAGFEDILSEEIDSIFTGHYSDTILSDHYMPQRMFHIPILHWDVPTPLPRPIKKIQEYIKYMLHDHTFTRQDQVQSPAYLRDEYDIKSILFKNIGFDNNTIVHHNVTYPSLNELRHTGGYYPLTNSRGYLFYYNLTQMFPTHCPYLDNRIVDLTLSMPSRYHTGKNIVNESLKNINPELANIPHSETGLPLTYPESAHAVSELLESFTDKIGVPIRKDRGSWPNHDHVLRKSDIVPQYLFNRDEVCWDEIDSENVQEIYKEQLDGVSHYVDLYGLLSLCNTYPFSEHD